MAYRQSRAGMGGTAMTKALGQMVGLLLVLYVFDRLIDAIWSVVNASVWFADAVALIQTLLPVLVLFVLERSRLLRMLLVFLVLVVVFVLAILRLQIFLHLLRQLLMRLLFYNILLSVRFLLYLRLR